MSLPPEYQEPRTAWIIREDKNGKYYVHKEKTIGITHDEHWIMCISTAPVAIVNNANMAWQLVASNNLETTSKVFIVTTNHHKSIECYIEKARATHVPV